jgi:hypothetical protein
MGAGTALGIEAADITPMRGVSLAIVAGAMIGKPDADQAPLCPPTAKWEQTRWRLIGGMSPDCRQQHALAAA